MSDDEYSDGSSTDLRRIYAVLQKIDTRLGSVEGEISLLKTNQEAIVEKVIEVEDEKIGIFEQARKRRSKRRSSLSGSVGVTGDRRNSSQFDLAVPSDDEETDDISNKMLIYADKEIPDSSKLKSLTVRGLKWLLEEYNRWKSEHPERAHKKRLVHWLSMDIIKRLVRHTNANKNPTIMKDIRTRLGDGVELSDQNAVKLNDDTIVMMIAARIRPDGRNEYESKLVAGLDTLKVPNGYVFGLTGWHDVMFEQVNTILEQARSYDLTFRLNATADELAHFPRNDVYGTVGDRSLARIILASLRPFENDFLYVFKESTLKAFTKMEGMENGVATGWYTYLKGVNDRAYADSRRNEIEKMRFTKPPDLSTMVESARHSELQRKLKSGQNEKRAVEVRTPKLHITEGHHDDDEIFDDDASERRNLTLDDFDVDQDDPDVGDSLLALATTPGRSLTPASTPYKTAEKPANRACNKAVDGVCSDKNCVFSHKHELLLDKVVSWIELGERAKGSPFYQEALNKIKSKRTSTTLDSSVRQVVKDVQHI
jgi:hypothetical protein